MFPQLFKNETTNWKRECEEGGADFMSYNRQLWSMALGNPIPELTLTALHSWL
jgi:hypothetical protein